MPDVLALLKDAPRVLIEVALKPIAGTRIQPTGFPDLGAATYDAPGKDDTTVPTLLVESAQSMANRLEAVCWDEGADEIAPELQGLPYVRVNLPGLRDDTDTTTSLQEFHRMNSPYIVQKPKDPQRTLTADGKWFTELLKVELGVGAGAAGAKKGGKKNAAPPTEESSEGSDKDPDEVAGVINLRRLATVCFKYDPNSLVHGVFLEKIAGRLRHPRALSAFIEASGVGPAHSGGVKFDRALPKPKVANVDAKGGYGNVPFHRTEFTARSIKVFFSLDLAQIRGYGLPPAARDLLIALSLWKVRKFLDSNMRLRSACELEIDEEAGGVKPTRPNGFALPSTSELTKAVRDSIDQCAKDKLFADPVVTVLTWNNPKG